nr:hypothetical protein [Tanacetum cinerariifolium]
MDRSWMYTAPRASKRYTNGVEYFLDFDFEKSSQNGTILYPCIDCESFLFAKRAVVYDHLICSGFKIGYLNWKDHGEVHEAAPLGNRREDEGIYQHDMHRLLDDLFPKLAMEGNNADTSEGKEDTSLNTKPVKNDGTKLNDLLKDVKQKAQVKYLRQGFMMFAAAVQEPVPNLNLSSVMNFMNMEADGLSSIHDNTIDKNPSSASGSSGLRHFFRYAMLSIHSIYVMSLYPFTERYAQPYFFSCFIRQRGYLYWKDHEEVHEAAPLGNRREDEGIYQHDMHGLLDDLFPTLPMEGNNADTSEGKEYTSLNIEPVKNDGYRFHTKNHENSLKSQNSGVVVTHRNSLPGMEEGS